MNPTPTHANAPIPTPRVQSLLDSLDERVSMAFNHSDNLHGVLCKVTTPGPRAVPTQPVSAPLSPGEIPTVERKLQTLLDRVEALNLALVETVNDFQRAV